MSEQPDFLDGAKYALEIGTALYSPSLASAQALIAIAERLDKQNDILESISNGIEFILETLQKR